MKTVFATALVVTALFTTFQIHRAIPIGPILRWFGESSISKTMPFDWKHAYASSSLDELETNRQTLRYQWANGKVRRKELEEEIRSLKLSIGQSKINLETWLNDPVRNKGAIDIEVRKHDFMVIRLEQSLAQLATLTQTMTELELAEAELTHQIQDVDHRLQMVQLNHARHQAQHVMTAIKAKPNSKGSLEMLQQLENKERMEAEYFKRFGGNNDLVTPDTAILDRARDIVGGHSHKS